MLIRPMHTSHHNRNVSRPTSRTRIIAPSYRCSAMHPHASKPFQKTFAKALLVIPRCSSNCHPMKPKRCEAVRLSGNESSVGLMTNQHSCPHVLVTPPFLQRRYHPPDWPTSFFSNTSSMSQLTHESEAVEDDVRTSANVERSRADRQRPASRREATGLARRSQSSDDLGHRLDPELRVRRRQQSLHVQGHGGRQHRKLRKYI